MATLDDIFQRIENKKVDYLQYNFTETENCALRIFFELAQEYDNIEDFYRVCVAIPKVFFDLHACLYLIKPKLGELRLVSETSDPGRGLETLPLHDVTPQDVPYVTDTGTLVLTIHGKTHLATQLPFKTRKTVLGLLVVYPMKEADTHRTLFFEKYANRIGFNLHNRFLVEKNVEHLRFIRSLVADIEHNIIVPNMVYKLFLRRLKGKIQKNIEIESVLDRFSAGELCDGICIERLLEELVDVNRGLMEEFENIQTHYQNMSLFLETLLRRSHFDQGRLTLLTKRCDMKKDVVEPQLERFAGQFADMGIAIDDRFSGIPEEEEISVVDVGLVAQVYANLFNNAVKYTQEITTSEGMKKKYVAYGREVIKGFFGSNKDGVKYNVFSTGPHVKHEERERIYDEEFRGSNALHRPGTGHGLAFVKNVVEMHGGVVGYEATEYGNNFYFILHK